MADCLFLCTGNNYAIFNESKRHAAKVFFTQGCEVETGMEENGPARS